MNLSETYSLYDCIFKDMGTDTDYNNSWQNNNNNTTVVRSSTDTTLTQTTEGTTGFYQTDRILPSNCTVEFDANLSVTSEVTSFRNNNTVVDWITFNEYSLEAGTWHHFKLEIDGTTMKPTVDGTVRSTATWSTTADRFVFRLNNQELTVKYRNFMIY